MPHLAAGSVLQLDVSPRLPDVERRCVRRRAGVDGGARVHHQHAAKKRLGTRGDREHEDVVCRSGCCAERGERTALTVAKRVHPGRGLASHLTVLLVLLELPAVRLAMALPAAIVALDVLVVSGLTRLLPLALAGLRPRLALLAMALGLALALALQGINLHRHRAHCRSRAQDVHDLAPELGVIV